MDFAVPVSHRVKIRERKKIDQSLDLIKEVKKTVEYESGDDTYCSCHVWNGPQSL